jgi:hypothetical protein
MDASVGLECVIKRRMHPPGTESRFSPRPTGSLVTLQTELLLFLVLLSGIY